MLRRILAWAAGAGLAIAAAASAAEPLPELRLLQEGQGLTATTNDVTVSPDGRHVYVSGDASFVVALRRRPSGRLALVEEYAVGAPATRIVAAGDGLGVLVITPFGHLVSYRRNPADGKLTFAETESAELSNSSFGLAASRDGERVYVTSPGQDAVVVYGREAATGLLTFAGRVRDEDPGVSGLVDPTLLAVSPDDRHVYVAAFAGPDEDDPETIVVLRREPDDSLVFVESLEVDELSPLVVGLGGLVVTPDGGELLVLDNGDLGSGGAAVLRYARNSADGRLTFTGAEPLAAPGFFGGLVAWFALRPDGERLFFEGFSTAPQAPPGGTTMAWSRGAGGTIEPLVRVDGLWGLSGRGVVSPDGKFVYATPALGVRVFAPEPDAGALGLAAACGLAALRRRARRSRPRARASARA